MRRMILALSLAACLASPAVAQTVEEGFAAYDAGDYAKARSILLPLAEAGVPKAMNKIGRMHDAGKGFPRNPTIACDWYEKGALKGYAGAQNNLNICFETGQGRPVDLDKSIYWAEAAASQGILNSQIYLIKVYHKIDPEKARYWGQKTADAKSVIGRLRMEAYGIPYKGPRVSRLENYCFLVMIDWFGKPDDYCDGISLSLLANGR